MSENKNSSNAHQMDTLQEKQFPKGNKNEQRTENQKLTKRKTMAQNKNGSSAHQMGTLQENQMRNCECETKQRKQMNLKNLFKNGDEEALNSELINHVETLNNGKQILSESILEGSIYVDKDGISVKNFIANRMHEFKKEFTEDYKQRMRDVQHCAIYNTYFDNIHYCFEPDEIYDELGQSEYHKCMKEFLKNSIINYEDFVCYVSMTLAGGQPFLMLSEKEKNEFENLPEKVTLYSCIEMPEEVTTDNAMGYLEESWTTSLEKCLHFRKENTRIVSIIIDKSDIEFYYNPENELAVICESRYIPHHSIQII